MVGSTHYHNVNGETWIAHAVHIHAATVTRALQFARDWMSTMKDILALLHHTTGTRTCRTNVTDGRVIIQRSHSTRAFHLGGEFIAILESDER